MKARFARVGASMWIVVLWAADLRAQTHAPSEELFARGREALRRGDVAHACEDFAASLQLAERVGTLLNLGVCEEQKGHLLKARGHWGRAATLAKAQADPRETVARERADALDTRIPRLTIRLAAGAPAHVALRRNNMLLAPDDYARPIRVDPGMHVLVVSAPGYAANTVPVAIGEGEDRIVEVAVGPSMETPHGPTSGASGAGATTFAGGDPVRKIATLASAAVGVAGIAGGTYFALRAVSKKGESGAPHCDATDACDDVGLRLRAEAREATDVATVAAALGIAGLTGAIVLWATAPSSTAHKIMVTPQGIWLRGQF